MPSLIINFIFLCLLMASAVAFASGGGEEKPAAETSSAPEYNKKLSELTSLENKVKESRAVIQDLIQHKNATSNREKKHEIVEQMIERHRQLIDEIKRYNEARHQLKYRFPEKDDSTERRYLPLKEQSLEQMEQEMGLDADLTRVKKMVDKKYAPLNQPEAGEPVTTIRPKKTEPEEEKNKKLRLEL